MKNVCVCFVLVMSGISFCYGENTSSAFEVLPERLEEGDNHGYREEQMPVGEGLTIIGTTTIGEIFSGLVRTGWTDLAFENFVSELEDFEHVRIEDLQDATIVTQIANRLDQDALPTEEEEPAQEVVLEELPPFTRGAMFLNLVQLGHEIDAFDHMIHNTEGFEDVTLEDLNDDDIVHQIAGRMDLQEAEEEVEEVEAGPIEEEFQEEITSRVRREGTQEEIKMATTSSLVTTAATAAVAFSLFSRQSF